MHRTKKKEKAVKFSHGVPIAIVLRQLLGLPITVYGAARPLSLPPPPQRRPPEEPALAQHLQETAQGREEHILLKTSPFWI
ncbi:hypothetical protein Cni_G23297 [Canna indica]|uniref:Uncharacterized protein n=1 Tax=Canna indica TaxID=4628 RepID=A0AAQ3KSW0_9LILI|nr:hypothetical protein Cni_G23297 [Canna indica]